MGGMCSKEEEDDNDDAYGMAPGAGIAAMLQQIPQGKMDQMQAMNRKSSTAISTVSSMDPRARRQSSHPPHVAMAGLGFALQHAGVMMGVAAHYEYPVSQMELENKIRLAKQNMQTITVKDGHLFIDYKYIGPIPPGMSVRG